MQQVLRLLLSIPAKTPERPLRERNLEDSSIIFLIAFISSTDFESLFML